MKNIASGNAGAKLYEAVCKGENGITRYELEPDDNNENKEILKNVSVTIDDHFVAITGPNGGGKSTLAKMIAGIIRPTSGQILLDGEDITGLNITERARKGISFAFQQPVHFKGLTVKDLITIAAGKEMSVNSSHKS